MFKALANFFFPLHCLACGQEGALACPTCRRQIPRAEEVPSLSHLQIFAALDYRDPLAAELVQALKYRGWKIAAEEMAELMLANLPVALAKLQNGQTEKIVLVPAPLSAWRRFRRGYNQAELIAKAIATLAPEQFEVGNDWVRKIRHTPSQVELKDRSERLENLSGAFALSGRGQVSARGRLVCLVDDVCTTGATLNELRRSFRAASTFDLIAWVFAHG